MGYKTLDVAEGKFNIFDTGRKYTGRQRRYMVDNVRSAIESDETQERLELREAFGYYGHGHRILSRNMAPGEVEVVRMEDGSKVTVHNIPCCVTTDIDISPEGDVDHRTELLSTDTGKVAKAMKDSGVGGFSWAMGRDRSGSQGMEMLGVTMVKEFFGMDYVHRPNFSGNRGYVLEDVGEDDLRAAMEVFESLDVADPEAFADAWRRQGDMLRHAVPGIMSGMASDNDRLLKEIDAMRAETAEAGRKEIQTRAGMWEGICGGLRVDMPAKVKKSFARMSGDDTEVIREYLNGLSLMDLSRYPLGQSRDPMFAPAGAGLMPKTGEGREWEYGDPSHAPTFQDGRRVVIDW